MTRMLVTLISILCVGCAAVTQPTYVPPVPFTESGANVIKVDKPFDEVWEALIEYSSKSFFAIKNFEKESGLLTLSFGLSEPEKYVDCGEIHAPHMDYEGPILNAVQTTGYVDLDGAMNLFVKPVDDSSTTVIVNTKYILSIKDGHLPKQTWSFDTYGYQARKQASLVITCRSTLVAERYYCWSQPDL